MPATFSPAAARHSAIAQIDLIKPCADSIGKELAAIAAEEGRAAFWSTATYSQSTWCLFRNAANHLGLAEALADETIIDDRHPMKTALALLDTLVPLNTKAIYEIRDAREAARWADAGMGMVA